MRKAKIIKNGNVNLGNFEFQGTKSFNELKDKLFSVKIDTEKMYPNGFTENWALEEAIKVANRSPCQSKRGVIIWHRKMGLISNGYNNIPKPFKCDGSKECKTNCAKTAIHAEQQALIIGLRVAIKEQVLLSDCEMLHVKSVNGKAVFSEKPSCWQCSKLILASELKYMWLYTKDGLIKYTAEEFHKQTLINNNLL